MTRGIASRPGAGQRILLLGPDDDARRAVHLLLDGGGKQVAAMADLVTARRYLASAPCDAVIATEALAVTLVAEPDGTIVPVIAVARSRDVDGALALFRAGVDEVMTEPIDELGLEVALRHVAALPRRVALAAALAVGAHAPSPLVGDGEEMKQLRETIALVAGNRSTVLILGESGTGKELVARAIHDASPRRANKFIAINCAAIPAALLETELFGHVKGAFTDAHRDKIGLFEDASGGTLFLDEVGELPLLLQVKLLRVLQEGEIRRVGEAASIKIDVRLIAATLRELADEVTAGRFREDLYYRLNVLPVRIPPLRERASDIPQLARFFAERHVARYGRPVALSDDALETLGRQPWPGNVRELENVIERALVLAEGPEIDAPFLATVMNVRPVAPGTDIADERSGLSIKKATRTLERGLIRRALGVTQGNRTNAAKLLEISHRALLYKMKEYGIS